MVELDRFRSSCRFLTKRKTGPCVLVTKRGKFIQRSPFLTDNSSSAPA